MKKFNVFRSSAVSLTIIFLSLVCIAKILLIDQITTSDLSELGSISVSNDEGTESSLGEHDSIEYDEQNDPILNSTEIMAEQIKAETNDTEMSADKGTSIEVHDNDNQENDEENDPITNLTKIMAEHIKTETNDTETSTDQGANIEVPENNKEDDPIPNSTDIIAEHIEIELHGTEMSTDEEQSIEVYENNQENDQDPNSTEIMANHIKTEFNDNAHATKSIIAARLGLMQASPSIIEEMSKVNISIVVSHCEAKVGWISEYIGKDYSVKDITIYSKCGKEVEGLEELKNLSPTVNVVTLPNVGRCDHSFAYWIKEHNKSVDKESDGNDIVMFLKDNKRHGGPFKPIELVFSLASKAGFGCISTPVCACNNDCKNDSVIPMTQHKRESLETFSLGRYSRLERDDSDEFLSEKYPDLKSWKEGMGFVVSESETMPVCFRGLFVAQKKQILNQPKESWEKMEASLSRTDNLIEGHYAERSWASILSDVNEESARAVDEVLSPHVSFVAECNPRKGLTFIHKDAQITIP